MEIYEKNNIKLINGDSLNRNILSGEVADLILTSPPYNIQIKYNSTKDFLPYEAYLKFSRKWLENCFVWAKPSCRLCLNIPFCISKGEHQPLSADIIVIAREIGWKFHSAIVWNKSNFNRRTTWGSWMSASAPFVMAPIELIIVFYKEQWKKLHSGKSDIRKEDFIKWTNGLWNFNGEINAKKIGHPAPFPKDLPLRCIKLFSFVGDTILDPFVGSGTTLVISMATKRKAIGIEIDETYFSLAKKNIDLEAKGLF